MIGGLEAQPTHRTLRAEGELRGFPKAVETWLMNWQSDTEEEGGSGGLAGNLEIFIKELAEEGVLGGTSRGSGELDGTSGKGGSQISSSLKQSNSSESSNSSPSVVGVWLGLSSSPSISTIIPTTHGVAGSHTWSVTFLSPGSGAMRGSVTLNGAGSLIAIDSDSVAAVGSGEHSVQ